MVVSANEVKKHGVSLFDKLFEKVDNVVLSVRGKKKYVVMDYKEYKELREYQLQKTYEEVMEDIKNGNYRVLSAKEHMKNLEEDLKNVSTY